MKWINGLTQEEKTRRKENWHRWFAWFPVTVGKTPEGRKIKVWWEHVERKGRYHGRDMDYWWGWEYLELAKKEEK